MKIFFIVVEEIKEGTEYMTEKTKDKNMTKLKIWNLKEKI